MSDDVQARTSPLMDHEVRKRALEARRAAAASRKARTREVNGYRLRPDSKPGVGWVIESLTRPGTPSWYFATPELAIAAIPRHQQRYADEDQVAPGPAQQHAAA